MTIALALSFMLVAGYWAVYPYKPLVIKNNPMPTYEKQVRAGDFLSYDVDYCKNTELPALVTRAFVDDVVFASPQIISDNEKSCRKHTVKIMIPNIPPGKYFVRITYTYEVNPIRSVTVTAYTQNFEIIK